MTRKRSDLLDLGPDVFLRFLPHRRPFLMVDRITHYARGPVPTLRAERYISASDPVFEGHFPELHLWPGIYIQEGLGQSCNLLLGLLGIQDWWQEQGRDPEDVLDALRHLELGHRLQPGYQPEKAERLLADLAPRTAFLGMAAAVEMKFLAPVFAGQRLGYEVRRTDVVGDMVRCELEARVDARMVAQGTMTNKMGMRLPRSAR